MKVNNITKTDIVYSRYTRVEYCFNTRVFTVVTRCDHLSSLLKYEYLNRELFRFPLYRHMLPRM
jgi:hypothetical protein